MTLCTFSQQSNFFRSFSDLALPDLGLGSQTAETHRRRARLARLASASGGYSPFSQDKPVNALSGCCLRFEGTFGFNTKKQHQKEHQEVVFSVTLALLYSESS